MAVGIWYILHGNYQSLAMCALSVSFYIWVHPTCSLQMSTYSDVAEHARECLESAVKLLGKSNHVLV